MDLKEGCAKINIEKEGNGVNAVLVGDATDIMIMLSDALAEVIVSTAKAKEVKEMYLTREICESLIARVRKKIKKSEKKED